MSLLSPDNVAEWVLKSVDAFDSRLIGKPRNGFRRISGQLLSPPTTDLVGAEDSSKGVKLNIGSVVVELFSVDAVAGAGSEEAA
jgi:hypothetical protein